MVGYREKLVLDLDKTPFAQELESLCLSKHKSP